MSDIDGKGFGDNHKWKKKDTFQYEENFYNHTLYQCDRCQQLFLHYYVVIPNIFYAMKYASIREECVEFKD